MKIDLFISLISTCMRFLLCAGLTLLTGCASTKLSIPIVTSDGQAKSLPVLSTQADAKNVQFAYQGQFGTISFYGGELIHSEPTRAGADVIRASGTAAGSVITSYYGGRSLLEGVRGNTAKNLDKGKTARHGESEKTTRHLSDNKTKVQMMEVQAQ